MLSVSRLYNINDRMVNKYEQLREWKLGGETEVLRENAAQCHSVYPKSHDLT
jgi:hypothetical protein